MSEPSTKAARAVLKCSSLPGTSVWDLARTSPRLPRGRRISARTIFSGSTGNLNYSRISSENRRFNFVPTAPSSVRIERAVRPCLPITFPRSPSATRSSKTVACSPAISFTTTPPGVSTRALAISSTSVLTPLLSFMFLSVLSRVAGELARHEPQGLPATPTPMPQQEPTSASDLLYRTAELRSSSSTQCAHDSTGSGRDSRPDCSVLLPRPNGCCGPALYQ